MSVYKGGRVAWYALISMVFFLFTLGGIPYYLFHPNDSFVWGGLAFCGLISLISLIQCISVAASSDGLGVFDRPDKAKACRKCSLELKSAGCSKCLKCEWMCCPRCFACGCETKQPEAGA